MRKHGQGWRGQKRWVCNVHTTCTVHQTRWVCTVQCKLNLTRWVCNLQTLYCTPDKVGLYTYTHLDKVGLYCTHNLTKWACTVQTLYCTHTQCDRARQSGPVLVFMPTARQSGSVLLSLTYSQTKRVCTFQTYSQTKWVCTFHSQTLSQSQGCPLLQYQCIAVVHFF